MLITPLGKSRFRPPVLLVPGWRSLTAYTPDGIKTANGLSGCLNLLRSFEGSVLFVSHSLKELINATGAGCWSASIWRGKVTSMSLDGYAVRVSSLRRLLDGVKSDADKYEALLEVCGWLESRRVAPGSLSAMAWGLWRSTLPDPLNLSFDSKLGRAAFYGGRQEATPTPAAFDLVALDISSAYPYEMASRPYAATLREVSTRTELDPEAAGIAEAAVKIPENLPHGPLPARIGEAAIYWPRGEIVGVWTWQELAAARSLGCVVEVSRCFAPLVECDPFSEWWAVVREARATMTPAAAKLIKALSNSLWGMFGMTGDDSGGLRWSDDYGKNAVTVAAKVKRLPQSNTAHIAAETTSRVRSRMLLEGLYGGPGLAANFPVHIDTDGIILPREALSRFSAYMVGDASGQWRVKEEIHQIEVKAPQLYRFKSAPRDPWQYVAAGMTSREAAAYFDRPSSFSVVVG